MRCPLRNQRDDDRWIRQGCIISLVRGASTIGTPAPEPGGSACCDWNGYGTQRSHPAKGLAAAAAAAAVIASTSTVRPAAGAVAGFVVVVAVVVVVLELETRDDGPRRRRRRRGAVRPAPAERPRRRRCPAVVRLGCYALPGLTALDLRNARKGSAAVTKAGRNTTKKRCLTSAPGGPEALVSAASPTKNPLTSTRSAPRWRASK